MWFARITLQMFRSVTYSVPNPTNHVPIYCLNGFSYPCPYLFQTGSKKWDRNFVFDVSTHTEQFRGVKAADRGGQAIGQPRPIHDDLQDF